MDQFFVSAYHLTESLKLKKFSGLFPDTPFDANAQRIIYKLSDRSFCLVYNFGSVVFFNVEEKIRGEYLNKIQSALEYTQSFITSDDFLVEVDPQNKPTIDFNKLTIKKMTTHIVELISLVLAQSTALEYFENEVSSLLKEIENVSKNFSKRRFFRISEKNILPFIEDIIRIKRKIIGSVYLLEKPESTWNSKEMYELYENTSSMFELKDRFKTLDYELQTIQEDTTLLASFTSNRQMLVMEAAIVGLFVLDLLLVGYEILFKY
ncbi:MAG: RMD1 family protein [Deltaproteobacteria bacterium]|nr:RMD1 family protein [Deltaproteobacteria bacterium]